MDAVGPFNDGWKMSVTSAFKKVVQQDPRKWHAKVVPV